MPDRREEILEAGLLVLQRHGFAGLTQQRVASEAGMRQSHLTYYYPTRLDLLAGIGRTAVDRQLAVAHELLVGLTSTDQAAPAIGGLVTRHETTRVLMALVQAGDQEPQLRNFFGELANGLVAEIEAFLARVTGQTPNPDLARVLHATSVGLAIVTLATGTADGRTQAESVLRTLLSLVGPVGAVRTQRTPDKEAAP